MKIVKHVLSLVLFSTVIVPFAAKGHWGEKWQEKKAKYEQLSDADKARVQHLKQEIGKILGIKDFGMHAGQWKAQWKAKYDQLSAENKAKVDELKESMRAKREEIKTLMGMEKK